MKKMLKKRAELFQAVECIHSMSKVDETAMKKYARSKVLDQGPLGVALKTKCKAHYKFYIKAKVCTLLCFFNIHEYFIPNLTSRLS